MKNPLLHCIILLSLIITACSEKQPEANTEAPLAQKVTPATADKNKPDSVHQLTAEAGQPAQQDSSEKQMERIVGTWLSEEDTNWKLVFTAEGICYQYYQEEALETEKFTISNTMPQCDEVEHIDAETSYLQLENIESNEKTCYEINGITGSFLSLRPLTLGGAMVFKRL
ncbi:hypothetical protein [Pontibacter ruber]|uniref:Lipocalin-like domain-containing protein n=1 Tax=Pontibacter ruber TaxID=1343895 RepID=A0ABW5CVR0_9BACT|nr:hypothetical protein [Pontibacter ruber]